MGLEISRAFRIGTLARKVIKGSKGELCGVFSSSMAIRYGDFAVYVTEDRAGQPFAINVDRLPGAGKEILIGEDIYHCHKGLETKRGTWFIDLSGAESWDAKGRLNRLPATPQKTTLAFDKVLQHLLLQDRAHRGLAALSSHVWRPGARIGSALDGINLYLYRRLMSIREELKRLDSGGVIESAQKMIGLGVGLTPSGDDFLTGLLLLLQMAEYSDKKHRYFIKQIVEGVKKLSRQTNIFGWSYLYGACHGHGAEVVLSAISELFEKEQSKTKLQRLTGAGATSGLDTLVGIAMGLDHLSHIAVKGVGNPIFSHA